MAETKGITAALIAAQKKFPNITKNKVNAYFNNARYADLDAIFDAVRGVLLENGILITQYPQVDKADSTAGVRTVLTHEPTGQTVENVLMLPIEGKFNPHSTGSAFTYAKRYALQALLAISADEDDDGNTAVGLTGKTPQPTQVRRGRPPVSGRKPVGPPRAEIPESSQEAPVQEKEEPYHATDDDLPPIMSQEPPLEKEAAQPYIKAAREFGKKLAAHGGVEAVRGFMLRTTGKAESKNLTKSEWETIINQLAEAEKSGGIEGLAALANPAEGR